MSQKKISLAEFQKLSVDEMKQALDAGLVEDGSTSSTTPRINYRNGRPIQQDGQVRYVNSVPRSNDASTQGVVGRLEQIDRSQTKEAYIKQLDADGWRFREEFPQVVFNGEDGTKNFEAINSWLKDNHV